MKYLNTYKLFESRDNQFLTSKKDIKNWLDDMDIDNYTINDDLTIDVDGDVDLNNKKLEKIPVKFKSVGGYFNCGYNQLTSLKGSPESVGGSFYCNNNKLTSLEGCPESVGGHFNCNSNPIEEVYNLFGNKECIKWLNEYNVIKGNKIILNNFKEVVYMMDMEHTFNYKKLYQLKNYKISE